MRQPINNAQLRNYLPHSSCLWLLIVCLPDQWLWRSCTSPCQTLLGSTSTRVSPAWGNSCLIIPSKSCTILAISTRLFSPRCTTKTSGWQLILSDPLHSHSVHWTGGRWLRQIVYPSSWLHNGVPRRPGHYIMWRKCSIIYSPPAETVAVFPNHLQLNSKCLFNYLSTPCTCSFA